MRVPTLMDLILFSILEILLLLIPNMPPSSSCVRCCFSLCFLIVIVLTLDFYKIGLFLKYTFFKCSAFSISESWENFFPAFGVQPVDKILGFLHKLYLDAHLPQFQ